MTVTADKPAPYAPSSAVNEIITRYRSRGLPTPITAEVLGRIGISESLQPRTLYALQALDLIDADGKPTDTFEGIRLAPEAEYKKRLEDWLKAVYADVFSVYDPMTDDDVRVRDAFRTYSPVGQQNRMITLFQGLCSVAGLMPEKQQSAAKPKAPIRVSGHASAGSARIAAAVGHTRPKHQFAGGGGKLIPAAIAGVLESLPPSGGDWTAAERDKFLKAFVAMLDFSFQVVEAPEHEAAAD